MKKYLLVFILIVIFAFCTQDAKADLIEMPEPDPALMHDFYCEYYTTNGDFVFNWVTDPSLWTVSASNLVPGSYSDTSHWYKWDGSEWDSVGWGNFYVAKPVFRDNVRCNFDTIDYTAQGGGYDGTSYSDVGSLSNPDTVSGISSFLSAPNPVQLPHTVPFTYEGVTYSDVFVAKIDYNTSFSYYSAVYYNGDPLDVNTSGENYAPAHDFGTNDRIVFLSSLIGDNWVFSETPTEIGSFFFFSPSFDDIAFSSQDVEVTYYPGSWRSDYLEVDWTGIGLNDVIFEDNVAMSPTEENVSFTIDYPSPADTYYNYIVQLPTGKDYFQPYFSFHIDPESLTSQTVFAIAEYQDEQYSGELVDSDSNLEIGVPAYEDGKSWYAPNMYLPDYSTHYFRAWLSPLQNQSNVLFYREFSITGVAPDDPMYMNAYQNKEFQDNTHYTWQDQPVYCDTGTVIGDIFCNLFRTVFIPSSDSYAWTTLADLKGQAEINFSDFFIISGIMQNAPATAENVALVSTTIAYDGHEYPITFDPFHTTTIPAIVPTIMTYIMYIGIAFFLIRKYSDLFPE